MNKPIQHKCAVCGKTEADSKQALSPFPKDIADLKAEGRITLISPNSGFAHSDCITSAKDKKDRNL